MILYSNYFLSIIYIIIIHILLFNFNFKKYFIKKNNTSRWSEEPAYLIGGFIFICFFIYYFFISYLKSSFFVFNITDLFFLIIIYFIGFFDDKYSINGLFKIFIYFLIIIVLNLYYNQHFDISSFLLINIFLFIIFISLNIIDNMDGIFPIYFLQVFIFILILLAQSNDLLILGCLPILLINFYFLFLNLNKSKNYLGDSGSYLLSAMIIILFLKSRFEIVLDNSLLINFVLLLTLFAYPIFDFIFVSLNRLYNGKSPIIGGIDHTSHIISRYYDSDKKCIILISSINLIYYLVVYLFFAYDLNILFNLFIIFIFYSILSFLMYIFRLQ